MARAIVNPEVLRRFAARLNQFNNEMISQLTTLHCQFARLAQTWRDRLADKFKDQDQTKRKDWPSTARVVDARARKEVGTNIRFEAGIPGSSPSQNTFYLHN